MKVKFSTCTYEVQKGVRKLNDVRLTQIDYNISINEKRIQIRSTFETLKGYSILNQDGYCLN